MEHLTKTPFGRPVTAGLLAAHSLVEAELSAPKHDKWQLFRAICTARVQIGITDRDLTVLNALLTFYPGKSLDDGAGLVVFPSNRALSERAHGMAESTLRRHLAALVTAGVILRHDSPNGKRYAARGRGGEVERAFGFSLRPLLVRAAEFCDAAEQATIAQRALKRRREVCVLMLRDASKLAAYAQEQGLSGNWDAVEDRLALTRRSLRRKLAGDDIEALIVELREALDLIEAALSNTKTKDMSGYDSQNERHYQNSKPEPYDSEPCYENSREAGSGTEIQKPDKQDQEMRLPLAVVLKACPDVQDYIPDGIRHWHQLVNAAGFLRGMMGISPDAWDDACRIMGPEVAAVTVSCILQRMDQINSPGGYLRSLTAKAGEGCFSCAPMVMALLNGSNKVAA